ncbi:hypothetical protein [Photobacterium kishitanii]|uniref:hypothetical protein n=1 Tax=Photobacterium kishitanii TaxID=318456 RepID=UPI0007F8A85A|nr:hypothetical protein [Photobacterium kishitanii]OBU30144.1 hypothetical protein AYY23_21775 [Photobacterium kishitanii]PSW46800.1 hypothetical protein C0W66_21690 [Photobacterium kishitanii]
MNGELKQLKMYIESSIVSERNHIFKYTSPLTRPESSQAKAVFLEYNRATSNDRRHNYNLNSLPHGCYEVEEKDIPNFYEFLANKLRYHFKKSRRSYVSGMISDPFKVYDEDGFVEDMSILDYEFTGEIDHEIFSSWLLFDHLFEIEEQIAKRVEARNFIGIQSHLNLIDDNFGFLMNRKDSYFQLKMDEDELYSWLLTEIISFQHQVEEKGLWKSLNKEPEKHFQWVFAAVLGRVSELCGVCMLAEPDVGSGKVDFIFSQGNNSKVCVELKLSSSSKVLEGYTKQIQQYLKSEKTDKGIYVVIDSGDSKISYSKLLNFIEDGKNNGQSYPEIILVDANPKISASKRR